MRAGQAPTLKLPITSPLSDLHIRNVSVSHISAGARLVLAERTSLHARASKCVGEAPLVSAFRQELTNDNPPSHPRSYLHRLPLVSYQLVGLTTGEEEDILLVFYGKLKEESVNLRSPTTVEGRRAWRHVKMRLV